jgi:hypothetical protein
MGRAPWLVLVAALLLFVGAHGICPAGWTEFGANCYVQVSKGMTWAEANTACNAFFPGLSRVVEVQSAAEHSWLVSVFQWKDTWIGMSQTANNAAAPFLWTSGAAKPVTFWQPGFPVWDATKNCVNMLASTGNWVNSNCWAALPATFCKTPVTSAPTAHPSKQPTQFPTAMPSRQPTRQPSAAPSRQPTARPSAAPSVAPSSAPSPAPSAAPSPAPSSAPVSNLARADEVAKSPSGWALCGAGLGGLVLVGSGAAFVAVRLRQRGSRGAQVLARDPSLDKGGAAVAIVNPRHPSMQSHGSLVISNPWRQVAQALPAAGVWSNPPDMPAFRHIL